MTATIPGTSAGHRIIRAQCRLNRGDQGAFIEACDGLREEYLAILNAWGTKKGATFHLALTVERDD